MVLQKQRQINVFFFEGWLMITIDFINVFPLILSEMKVLIYGAICAESTNPAAQIYGSKRLL